jgi:HSP20 family protein
MKKRSFFERLTGSVNIDEDELQDTEEEETTVVRPRGAIQRNDSKILAGSQWLEEQAGDGELSVDVYQTPDEIIVKAMIPGVRKDEMDISISRDSITIRGSRKEEKNISEDDYVVRELYWGTFSRTVQFPHEVDIEHAEAIENQGLLTIKLPRVDKERQAKLKIKSI